MQATIYIRKENEEVWAVIEDKSEWINYHLTERRTKGQTQPKIKILADVIEDEHDEVFGYLDPTHLEFIEGQGIYDKKSKEWLEEITKEMADELKKRGQVKR